MWVCSAVVRLSFGLLLALWCRVFGFVDCARLWFVCGFVVLLVIVFVCLLRVLVIDLFVLMTAVLWVGLLFHVGVAGYGGSDCLNDLI